MRNEYAIYLRKSRADIELEKIEAFETLARHEHLLNELAKKQGLKIGKIYKEIVSGESLADRPQAQQLLKDVINGMWKGVLVVEVERLARGDTKDQGEVAEAFKFSNTLIVTPTKTYDPNNEFDEEYFEFGLFMSRREYKTIRRRMQRGLIDSVKEGNYLGSLPPYGYDIIRIDKKTRTLKHNNASKYVIMIFEWFVNENKTPGEIARTLTNMGVPTLTGKSTEWHRATVKDILQNDLYTGKIRWNRRKVTKEYDGEKMVKTKKRKLREDYILVDGKHPALISQEMFDKAQENFTHTVPKNIMTVLKNPLAGILVCKHCGKTLAFQEYAKRKTPPRFTHRESQTCKVKSMPASEVYEAIIHSLKLLIEDFEFKMTNEYEMQKQTHQLEMITSMKKELDTLKIQRSKLFDYLERKIYTEDEFVERKGILTAKIKTLNEEIEKEEQNTPAQVDYQEKIYNLKEVINTLKDENITAEDKNYFIKRVIEKIEYDVEDLGRGKGGVITLDIFLK